jgi:NIMA (never in mitosis gene a)-related kinase
MVEISYNDEFEELRCIGRGNFGAAFLVKHRNPPPEISESYFIAKKIVLGQLSTKEQEQALLEAQLLKDLNHVNIVSYRCSFVDKDVLIIIMEFCEMGDLSYHVKKKRSKNESFSETEIMNWFVQICMALEYVHRRRVLHRDLKSQNVFLTANNTIKLGDFGISKVLENTCDAALTVQGTPYYMSPEVC